MSSVIEAVGRRGRRGSRASTVAVVLVCVVLGGCASGTSTAPPAAPPATATAAPTAAPTPASYSAELCSAAARFQTAGNALVTLDAGQAGVDGVKQALQDLGAAASGLVDAARAQFAPQVAELERAISSLQGTIAGLSSQDSVSTNLGEIAASVGAVERAAAPIVDSVRTGCPAVPPVELPPTG